MRNRVFAIYLMMLTVLLLASSATVLAAAVPRMTTDELKSHLGEKDLVVLDVRANRDWIGARDKITGAKRVEAANVNQWADNFEMEKTIVLYCA